MQAKWEDPDPAKRMHEYMNRGHNPLQPRHENSENKATRLSLKKI
jgi:hypothetical protein